jgi:hypothetical protein
MDDFAFHIAAGEKLPRFIFGIEALDPTVLIYDLPKPKRVEYAIGRAVYSVARILNFVNHDGASDALQNLRRTIRQPPRAELLSHIASKLPYLIRMKIQHFSLPGGQAASRQGDQPSSR